MNAFLTQIVLAARNQDSENGGWMQILVIVVMAVFWIFGGILKAKSGKTGQGNEAQPEDEDLRRRREQRRDQLLQRKIVHTQPFEQPKDLKLSLDAPRKEVEELVNRPGRELVKKRAIRVEKVESEAAVSSPLLDFSTSDKLKEAILHYEILGKPLSLRDPLER